MGVIRHTAHGVSWNVDPDNPHQRRGMTILMVVSGLLLAIGVTLCSLESRKILQVPWAVRNFVLGPISTICSSVFLMTLLGFVVSKGSQEQRKTTDPTPTATPTKTIFSDV